MCEGIELVVPSLIGHYELRGPIGNGAFSVVYLAKSRKNEDANYYAIKIIPKKRLRNANLIQRFEIEIRINQQLHHPGIVELYDVLKDENNYYLVMEFCPNGELFQHIVDKKYLTEQQSRPIIHQIFETIYYIHKMGVSHRDLKPENLLLDTFGKVKISDFGLSNFIDSNGFVTTPCGSPCYASPECLSGEPYSGRATDMWSVGVIFFAMLTGHLPWTKRNKNELFHQIKTGDFQIPNFLSPECQDLIGGLLCLDSNSRLTAKQALQHRWLYGVVSQYNPDVTIYSGLSLKKVDLFFGGENSFDIINFNENIYIYINDREKTHSSPSLMFDRIMKYITLGGFADSFLNTKSAKNRNIRKKGKTSALKKSTMQNESTNKRAQNCTSINNPPLNTRAVNIPKLALAKNAHASVVGSQRMASGFYSPTLTKPEIKKLTVRKM